MSVNPSLKAAASKGILWSALNKFIVQGTQFIIGIILARLLLPEDFGLIAMLSIFLVISQSLVDSGMGSGLIQKQDRSMVDFSTVFVFNFFVSLFLYIVLYISAPLIADFFNMPQLVLITRVLSLNIIINSLAIVQRSKLTINIDFKTLTKVNVIAVIFGGSSALFLAYQGWGVWALVAQTIIGSMASIVAISYLSRWKPSVRFSKESFNALFGYGSKLLLAGIYAQTLNNVYNLAIGKAYTSAALGFYTKAKDFSEMSSGTVYSVLQQVSFPILSSLQDDQERMVSVYRRLIRMTAFFIFPLMSLLSLLADPFVKLILGENWIPVIVLLQWMSFAKLVYPISAVNLNILKAVGRSDLYLKVDLLILPIIIIAMVITIPLGVKAIVIGHVVTSAISFFIYAYMPGKLFGYGALKQLKDLRLIILSTVLMSGLVFIINIYISSQLGKLLIGGSVGLSTYYFITSFFKMNEINEVNELAKKLFLRTRR